MTPIRTSLNGEIDAGAALNFRRAAEAAPNAKLVVLNSPGGVVQIALLIADDVHERKLATYIPKKAGCYSACAFIFLAGVERQVDGELGVHQISSDSTDLVSAQLSISDIIDVLNRFNTPVEVLTVMFKTPPKDMHIFTPDEVARYGLDRKQNDHTTAASKEVTPSAGSAEPLSAAAAPAAAPAPDPDTVDGPSLSKLSSIEEYTRRPTRMAVFTGLFFTAMTSALSEPPTLRTAREHVYPWVVSARHSHSTSTRTSGRAQTAF